MFDSQEERSAEANRKSKCPCGHGYCYIDPASLPARIIFLDFDGVLNCSKGWKRDEPPSSKYVTPECVEQLGRILGACPDAMVCISSTWRRFYTVANLGKYLAELEIPAHRIVSRTPTRMSDRLRGNEIQEWLDEHPFVKRFVILDDDSDMAHLLPKLVHTDFTEGLTKEKAEDAIRRLG